jgi:hypothetical protein
MINDSKQLIQTKLKNRDIISYWNYVNRNPFQNLKYRVLQTILNVLEKKPKVIKDCKLQRVTDAHFDSELRYLVKDQPVFDEGLTKNGFVKKN